MRLTSVIVALFAAGLVETAKAQSQPPTVGVVFKVFDSNDPSKPVRPISPASVFVRDPVTKKPQFLNNVAIKDLNPDKSDLKDKSFEVQIFKGWLVEQLVIGLDDPDKDYNPAVATKFVSAAPMTMYPGASRSSDDFGFLAYVGQLGTYKSLLQQVLDEDPPLTDSAKEDRRKAFREAFGKRLEKMADALVLRPNTTGIYKKRLLTDKPEELAAARKLVAEVFELYGMPIPPFVQEPIVQPIRRCCFFWCR